MHQGSCQCGALRYQLNGDPLTCYACHCTDCQTSTGSAFTLSMIVRREDVRIIEGEAAINTFMHNGSEVQRYHCGNCGTAFWYLATEMPKYIALKPGTFDETDWFTPVAHIWLRSAQTWVVLDETTARYQKQPKMIELFKLWAEANR